MTSRQRQAPAPAEKAAAETPAEPPPPAGPLEVKVPAGGATVKLISAGKGKRELLRYAAKPGNKQQVKLTVDFHVHATDGKESADEVAPTLVLVGTAETRSVDKDGTASFAMTITSADARDVTGAMPAAQFKQKLGSLSSLIIGGTLGANGIPGEVTMRIEKPDKFSPGALNLLKGMLPPWPALPKEPVGVGAKWTTTYGAKLARQFDVTHTTSYELVARKGATWTVKGTTTVTGSDQAAPGGKVGKITGTGAVEASLADAALYPANKSSLETKFQASEDKTPAATIDYTIKAASSVK